MSSPCLNIRRILTNLLDAFTLTANCRGVIKNGEKI